MSDSIFHPVADLFPRMTGAALDELVADIKANGLREPIWRHEGKIIDGCNRYLACEKAGVEPTYREWDGKGSLVQLVVSLNLHRRHLNESQRAMIAAKIAQRPRGLTTDRPGKQDAAITASCPTLPEAASMCAVNKGTVSRAKRIRREAAPEVVAAVESGEITIHAATKIIDEPREQQLEALRDKREGMRRAPKNGGNGDSIHTRTHPGRKAPKAIRHAIGTLVGLATGLDSFTAADAEPTTKEAEHWDKDLALVISSINRFRRQLREYVNGKEA